MATPSAGPTGNSWRALATTLWRDTRSTACRLRRGPITTGAPRSTKERRRSRACFPAALDWMLVNYAYYTDAFMGKGGIISLVDGKMRTIASLRGFMQPYTIVEEGPRGGLKKTSVVDVWMTHPLRAHIDAVQTRPDKPRPTFTEDGLIVYNRYWPPAHPTSGGEIATFETFFARLVPDDGGTGMVLALARPQGAPAVGADGRGDHGGGGIRDRPRDAVRHPRAAVRRGLRRAVLVRRADGNVGRRRASTPGWPTRCSPSSTRRIDEDGHQQTQRRLTYEALKNAIDPSPTARRRFEAKGQHAYAQRSAMIHDHRDPASRRGEAAARRPALRASSPAAAEMTAAETDGDPGLDGGPGEHRRAPSGAAGDAGGAARRVRPVWRCRRPSPGGSR